MADPHELPPPLASFCRYSAVLTVLSISAALLQQVGSLSHGGLGVLWMDHPGFDFYAYEDRLPFLHTGHFFSNPGFPWYYPAPAVFFYAAIHQMIKRLGFAAAIAIYISASLAGAGFLAAKLHDRLRAYLPSKPLTQVLSCIALTSWPIYFSLERGNIESILWLLLAAGIALMVRQQWYAASVVIGICGGVKIYPLLCLGIFVVRKKFGPALLALVIVFVETVVALRAIDPHIGSAYLQVKSGVSGFTSQYALTGSRLSSGFDHSIFESVKLVLHPFPISRAELLKVTLPVLAVLAAAIFFFRMARLPLFNQVLYILCLCVSLPPASFDYTLQNLYIPFAWAVVLIAANHLRRAATLIMTSFAVIFAPLTFFVVHGIALAGPIKCVAILTLIGVSVAMPLDEPSAVISGSTS